MPEVLEAKFRIVTPMFLGGANQDISDGIRPPSLKGALRFWWRALNWGRFVRDASCVETALVLLHGEEVRLFGGSAEQGGQGCFHLSVLADRRPMQTISDWPQNNTGSGYLAFGILESGSQAKGNYQPHRRGFTEHRDLGLRFVFRPGTRGNDIATVDQCLRAWGLFGGLGSRARRGMGSVARIEETDMFSDLSKYQCDVDAVLTSFRDVPLSPYTSFSNESAFRVLAVDRDPRRALGSAGQLYKDFRDKQSDLRGAVKIPFGLPLQDVDTENRRASPLFFHVHALADEQYVATVLYLPSAMFHPKYPDASFETVTEFAKEGGA